MKKTYIFRNELIDIAYKYLNVSSLAVVINASVLFLVLYGYINTVYLISWYISVLIVAFLRFSSLMYYKHNKNHFNSKIWEQLFLIGVVVAGILWGITPFILFVKDSFLHQMILIIVLAGISAGAINSLSSIVKATRIFLIIVIFPLIIVSLMQEPIVYKYVAVLEIVYLIMLLRISNQFYKQYLFIIQSKIRNKLKEEKLLVSEGRFEKIFKEAPIGMLLYDNDLIVQEVNQSIADILEVSKEKLLGLDLKTLSDNRVIPSLLKPLRNINDTYEGEYITKFKNKKIWINAHTSPLLNYKQNVIGAIAIITEVTDRVQDQWLIEHQAKYDALTNIPNRTYLMEHINYNIHNFRNSDMIFSILFLDIDNFKNINDSLGHSVGDALLVQIARRFKSIMQKDNIVARLGGDEFVFLLSKLSTDKNEALKKADILSDKIHSVLSETFKIKNHYLNISASVGIVIINNKKDSADDLLKYADVAMYQAKKDGRCISRHYHVAMQENLQRRIDIENGLRRAIKNKELQMYYQPVVSFETGEIIGAEALLRWNNEKLGFVGPDEFIIIAEESGSMYEIGEWVLHQAIEQFVKWKKDFPNISSLKKIAINVSSKQFNHPDFIMQLNYIINKNSINPKNLELELTESIILNDADIIANEMQKLRELGINISIDDFGTGYSSLSYLKKLPFSTLKIDKSFTQDISDESDDEDLVSTIINISKNFNMEIIAEGIETEQQYKYLKDKGCDYMQGYYCSKPVTAEDFTDSFLKKYYNKENI